MARLQCQKISRQRRYKAHTFLVLPPIMISVTAELQAHGSTKCLHLENKFLASLSLQQHMSVLFLVCLSVSKQSFLKQVSWAKFQYHFYPTTCKINKCCFAFVCNFTQAAAWNSHSLESLTPWRRGLIVIRQKLDECGLWFPCVCHEQRASLCFSDSSVFLTTRGPIPPCFLSGILIQMENYHAIATRSIVEQIQMNNACHLTHKIISFFTFPRDQWVREKQN